MNCSQSERVDFKLTLKLYSLNRRLLHAQQEHFDEFWRVRFACRTTPTQKHRYIKLARTHLFRFLLRSRVVAHSDHSLPVTSKRACSTRGGLSCQWKGAFSGFSPFIKAFAVTCSDSLLDAANFPKRARAFVDGSCSHYENMTTSACWSWLAFPVKARVPSVVTQPAACV